MDLMAGVAAEEVCRSDIDIGGWSCSPQFKVTSKAAGVQDRNCLYANHLNLLQTDFTTLARGIKVSYFM